MQCVVLAGGTATRMRPRTESVPKWILPVAGRAFAAWQLEWLAASGVESVVACIGHLGDRIRETVGSGEQFGVRVTYSEDGPTLLGTAGALRLAADRRLVDRQFLVMYGDSYLSVDVPTVWEAFRASGRPALMTVFRNEGRFDVSNAAYEDGQVVRYAKGAVDGGAGGPELHHIDYGLSVLERTVLDEVPAGEVSDLAVLFESLSDRGALAGLEVAERFYEIGSPAGLRDLEQMLGPGRVER